MKRNSGMTLHDIRVLITRDAILYTYRETVAHTISAQRGYKPLHGKEKDQYMRLYVCSLTRNDSQYGEQGLLTECTSLD